MFKNQLITDNQKHTNALNTLINQINLMKIKGKLS